MILKKPYALLIKYFKFIHFILSVFIAFVTLKTYNLYTFFSTLSKTNYVNITKTDILTYYSPFLYLSIVVIIIISIIIFFLMKFKQKPKLYYILLIVINVFLLFYISYSKNYMNTIIYQSSNPITNGILRDLSFFTWIIVFASIFFSILRSIGFDVKKFNFKKDIADLKIEELDNEEIEFNVNIKKYDITRNINKTKTSIKNFLKAKKLIFIIVILIFLFYFVYIFIMNTFFYNKSYKENEYVTLLPYTYKINKSYYTNIDSSGNPISSDYKYIIVNLEVYCKTPGTKFNISNVLLESNNKNYFPIFNAYSLFLDLGVGYDNQELNTSNKNTYILVFRVDNEIDIDNIKFKHFDKMIKNGKKIYKTINLNPVGSNNNKIIKKNLNDELNFNNKSINIKSYSISNKFEYKYNFCLINNNCIESTDNLKVDKGLILKLMLNDFTFTTSEFINYGYLTYDNFFNKNIIIPLNSITPKKATNELYFVVPTELKEASHIYLNFLSREKKYVYVIK